MAQAAPVPTTIKDPELVAQRRAEIVDVATRLFLERGFHKTSIRDIVRACPFNVASLYMYVSSKEDILFLVAQHLMTAKAKTLSEIRLDDTDPVAAFRLAFRRYCEIIDRFRPHVKLLYRELDVLPPPRQQVVLESISAVTDVFEKIIARGMGSGAFRAVEPRLVAFSALSLAHMWSLNGWALKRFVTIDRFIEAQTDFLLRGLVDDARGAARPERLAASG